MIFGRKQGQENKHYNKRKQIRYFNIINIAERWCEIGCTSKTSITNPKLKYAVSSSYIFLDDSTWLYKCQCFCLFDIQKWSVLS